MRSVTAIIAILLAVIGQAKPKAESEAQPEAKSEVQPEAKLSNKKKKQKPESLNVPDAQPEAELKKKKKKPRLGKKERKKEDAISVQQTLKEREDLMFQSWTAEERAVYEQMLQGQYPDAFRAVVEDEERRKKEEKKEWARLHPELVAERKERWEKRRQEEFEQEKREREGKRKMYFKDLRKSNERDYKKGKEEGMDEKGKTKGTEPGKKVKKRKGDKGSKRAAKEGSDFLAVLRQEHEDGALDGISISAAALIGLFAGSGFAFVLLRAHLAFRKWESDQSVVQSPSSCSSPCVSNAGEFSES